MFAFLRQVYCVLKVKYYCKQGRPISRLHLGFCEETNGENRSKFSRES